jgi:hypothetical protein
MMSAENRQTGNLQENRGLPENNLCMEEFADSNTKPRHQKDEDNEECKESLVFQGVSRLQRVLLSQNAI